jgi:hypothetical protein
VEKGRSRVGRRGAGPDLGGDTAVREKAREGRSTPPLPRAEAGRRKQGVRAVRSEPNREPPPSSPPPPGHRRRSLLPLQLVAYARPSSLHHALGEHRPKNRPFDPFLTGTRARRTAPVHGRHGRPRALLLHNLKHAPFLSTHTHSHSHTKHSTEAVVPRRGTVEAATASSTLAAGALTDDGFLLPKKALFRSLRA